MRQESDDRSFLFIVTHGRSGSTLLQGVLNSIPGFTICGENMDACQYLYRFYDKWYNSIKNYHGNNMPVDSRNSWYQCADFDLLKISCRNLLWNLCACHDTRVAGFKEIRWKSHYHSGDLDRYLFWFFQVFNPRFIHLTRDMDETCNSKWFKGKDVRQDLEGFNYDVSNFFGRYGYIDSFHLDLGRLHDGVSPERFRLLFDWLGEEYVESDIQKVLDVRWGY